MSNKASVRLIASLGNIEECIRRNIKDFEIAIAAQEVALSADRIFGKHVAADAQTSFGTYRSKQYKKKRERNKLQTLVKDLQFTGDLRKDLDIGEYNGNVAVGFRADRSADIVKYQESDKQIGAAIFSASEDEIDILKDLAEEEFNKLIDLCLKAS